MYERWCAGITRSSTKQFSSFLLLAKIIPVSILFILCQEVRCRHRNASTRSLALVAHPLCRLRGAYLFSGLTQGDISSLKMRALEQINNRSIYVLERGMPRGHPGDQQHVPSARDGRQATTDCFPHESLDPVAKHCFANLAAHRERKTALGAIVGRLDQNKQPVVPRSSLLSQHPDLCAVSQAVWFS